MEEEQEPGAAASEPARRASASGTGARVEDHLPALRSFVRRALGAQLRHRESESDIVQSTCREALLARDRIGFRDAAHFRRWLLGKARNKILDRARHHRRACRDPARVEAVDPDAVPWGPAGPARASPSGTLERREAVARLEQAFARLSESHRTVIREVRLSGECHRTVARRHGRSEVANRALLKAALERLATEMARARLGTTDGRDPP